jgi:hypothetical protein
MILLSDEDFADSGLTISQAFVKATRSYSGDKRPGSEARAVLWGGQPVVVGDVIKAPLSGTVRLEFISSSIDGLEGAGELQGADLDVSRGSGSITLSDGSKVSLLRTWFEPGLPPEVTYPYESPSGVVGTYNVCQIALGGTVRDEKWSDNAGMIVEEEGELSRLYRCSHCLADPPDFTNLVYRVTITPSA